MSHTPVPWKFGQHSLAIYADNGVEIASTHAGAWGMMSDPWANGQFIVRACNAHEDLVEACKTARWLIGTLIEQKSVSGFVNLSEQTHEKLIAAMAKAEPRT